MKPKICAYVQAAYSKQNYSKECMETRQFVGLRVIIDVLERNGYEVEYAGSATVHNYDFVLVSLTSDCDWWTYISERLTWRKGGYKVIVGGAGLLHISPFLPFGDYFIWGRGEGQILSLLNGTAFSDSVTESGTFSEDNIYHVAQANKPYPYPLKLPSTRSFEETTIGCNHKCLFCGYTWQRKFMSPHKTYKMQDSLFGNIETSELAMLDMARDFNNVDFAHLRTTAIDGFSERLRFMVKKPITRKILVSMLAAMAQAAYNGKAKPHQMKIYNICGYPTETEEDMKEFAECLQEADSLMPTLTKQWSIVLHSTPFRPMPATPLACAPMSYKQYRGEICKVLRDKIYKGNIFYQGRNFWAVESMGTESLSTVILSAIAHRGERRDTENIIKMCSTPKFWAASSKVKQITLEKYFNVEKIFGAYTPETLPSRYLRTYLPIEKAWDKKWR